MLKNKKMVENFIEYVKSFSIKDKSLFGNSSNTKIERQDISGHHVFKYINEFWTSKQRKASSIHELSFRACFKPQLPEFFIKNLTQEGDYVYDPFLGRGTTMIEAALLNRKPAGNDINPLSKILTEGRFLIPDINELKDYLDSINYDYSLEADIDLSMFFHPDTESELVSLKNHLLDKEKHNELSDLDKWIRMIATNRLTGHSRGFFSVYTMPPNQAVSPERQIKINQKRNQKPEYRNTKELILHKSKTLLKDIKEHQRDVLAKNYKSALFYNRDAGETKNIPGNSIQLTVTSPPFLNIVQYSKDNWMRCWFNGINTGEIEENITMARNINQWIEVMQKAFDELFCITKPGGFVAFEVGEVKNGKILLDEYVIPLGVKSGFTLIGILVNQQEFTKTANIWGINNNAKGTNSNRIVLFQK